LSRSNRKIVDKTDIVFDPRCNADPEYQVNLFNGFEMKPKPAPKEKYDKILDLLRHLCDGNAEVMAWVLRWIAYPLQNPGAKMRSSIIVHGDEGSGKNFFFEGVVAGIYGEYGGVIGNAQIESQFNEWASRKLFMVADEVVTRAELRQLKGKLKALVTGGVVRINSKNLSERDEANHMNFVFLSNELQPLALDQSDRRYLVMWTPPKLDDAFYQAVGRQVKNGGIEAFYHYLLSVPMEGFNEHSRPPVNDAKENLIALGLSPPERFYHDWSGGFLSLPFVCCSAQQLYSAFTRWCVLNGERYFPSQQFFGRAIDRAAQRDGVRRTVMKYDLGHDVKQRTVYLLGLDIKPDDKSLVDFVADASALFEEHLKKYRGGVGRENDS
jgi:putative DNA primase/helicase